MKTLKQYILEIQDISKNVLLEADGDDITDEMDLDASKEDNPDNPDENIEDKNDDKDDMPDKDKLIRRGNIKFTIWEDPKKKVNWLKDNQSYQKIEYQYRDKEKGINIDFLLGFQDKSWKLWIGKIGAISYDDDPWCSFETDKFSEGIVAALDKVEEFIDDVNDNPDNWVQFYI